jgi:hypothetical protein
MPNLTAYIPAPVLAELKKRGLGSGENVVRRDLERYYALLSIAMQRVSLTQQELNLLCDVLNGVEIHTGLLPYLPQVLADAVGDARKDGYDEKWGVDTDALAEKIRSLSVLDALAIVDAVEQFWESRQSE